MVGVLGEFTVAREDSQGSNSINQVKGLVRSMRELMGHPSTRRAGIFEGVL